MKRECYANDATHANEEYGELVLRQLERIVLESETSRKSLNMSDHPYKHLPDKAFWRRSVAAADPASVDPVGDFGLRITQETKVATAGSCFAQHIARHLKNAGFNYYVAEPGHPILPDARP